jgi:hypothetical protein
VKTAEDTVASAGDMAAGSYPVTGASRKCDSVLLVEAGVSVAEARAGSDLVGVPAAGGIHSVEQAYVEENSSGIVADEIFVAVTAGANRGTKAGANGLLKCLGDVIRVLAYLDATDSFRLRGWPAKIVALPEGVKAGILS